MTNADGSFFAQLTAPAPSPLVVSVPHAGVGVSGYDGALSPDLVAIHDDQRWPFLGGTAAAVAARYQWAAGLRLTFPSPFPHPLG